MIKNIFFDVMGVVFVVGDDTNELLVPFIQKFNKIITKEQINEYYSDASSGKMTSDKFWLKVGVDESRINLIETEYLDKNFISDTGIIDIMKILKEKGYKIGLLSNDLSEWSEFLRNKFGLNDLVDYCVISGEAKSRKPDEAIYKYAIRKYKIDPHESVFVDDRYKNLVPAEKLGFKTVLFDRNYSYKENTTCKKVNDSRGLLKIIDSFEQM